MLSFGQKSTTNNNFVSVLTMYVWSIKNPGEQAVQTLRMAKSCRCANRTIVRELKSFLASNVVAHDELLQLLNAGLNSLTNDIGSKKERVFIVECAAAFDYAFRHKNAGTFMLVRGAMVCSKRKNTICDYIRMKGTAILKNQIRLCAACLNHKAISFLNNHVFISNKCLHLDLQFNFNRL